MKHKNATKTMRFLLAFFILIFGAGNGFSQSVINVIMKNVASPNPNKVTFEIWLENASAGANASDVLSLQSFQFSFGFNAAVANGGTITPSLEAGNSAWSVVGQQTPAITSTNIFNVASLGTGLNFFRLAAATASAPATVIPTTANGGIRYATFAFTNSVAFATGTPFNFLFNTTVSTNGRVKTQVNAYLGALTLGAAWNDPAQTVAATGYPTSRLLVVTAPAFQIGSSNVCATTATASNIVNPVCPNGTGSATVTLTPTPTTTTGTYTINGGASQTWSSNPFTVTGLPIGSNTISVTSATCTTPATGTITITGSTTPLTNTTNATACDTYTWSVNSQVYTTSGTYTATSTNGSGCTVTETLILTINNSSTSSVSATACDTYTWSCNGTVYTTSGAYTCTSLNAAGCTNTATLNLTINNNTTSNSSATACDTYTWSCNGTTYTTSGAYTCTSLNASGCTNTETLNLTINNSTTSSSSATACDTYTWSCNGTTYTASGAYTCTSLNTAGCTNTETLNLTINISTTSSSSATSCDTYTWSCNGTTYTASGAYTCTSLNASGCTNTETLNLTINTSSTSSSSATACDTYTWSCNGTTYTASGAYTCTSLNASGCTNTETLNLTINTSSTSSSSATACDTYTWSCNGTTYTASGAYTCTSLNASGCTNTETLNLTINSSSTSSSSATACDTYTWSCNGTTYTASGVYTCTSLNAAGCTNTETLNLTINTSTTSNSSATACDTYTWSCNGTTYTASGVYTCTSLNAAGCTNTETLNLTINNSTTSSTSITACNSYTWSCNGTTYTASGAYTCTSLNAAGCTNTETLNLAINNTTTSSSSITACNSYTWSCNGNTYTTSGSYTCTTTNTSGCINIETLNLTITAPTSTSTSATVCDTYTWSCNGTTYTIGGTYTCTSLNAGGCTDTATLNLTINNNTSASSTASACDTYTWSCNGTTYTISGAYTCTSLNAAGCTNTETLNLTINNSSTNTSNVTACDSYTWSCNGIGYVSTGTYTCTSMNAAGCLHTEVLNLTINNNTTSTLTAAACGTYTWSCNNVTYTTSGTYTCTSSNANGCVNTATLNLTIGTNTSVTNISETACNTYTWSCNGNTYTASGLYTCVIVDPNNGCTATTNLNLTITSATSNTTTASACDSYTWSLSGAVYTSTGLYTYTTMGTGGCVHTEILDLTINNSVNTSVVVSACATYTWGLNGVTYTASGTYTYTGLTAAGCTEITTLNLTISTGTAVTGINVTNITGVSATLNWDPISGNGWYQVRYRPTTASVWTVATQGAPAVSKNIIGLLYSTSYEVQMRSFCSLSFVGPWSSSVFFTTSSSCNTPSGLAVSGVTGASATVNWNAMTNAGFYKVRYKPATSSVWIVGTTTPNTKLLTGLISGTLYDVQVATSCSGITSAYSSTVQFTTNAPCGTPSGINAFLITNTTTNLNWTPVSGATYYGTRYRATTSSTWINGSNATPSKNITGLLPATQYEIQITAYCGSSTPGAYTPSYVWTTANGVPPVANGGNKIISTEPEAVVSNINIYPNPTSDVLNIDLTATEAQTTTIKILDLSGRLIKQVQMKSEKGVNPMSISLAELANGIYALQVYENDSMTHVSKIEKK